jgi:AraC family transcriptional regulator
MEPDRYIDGAAMTIAGYLEQFTPQTIGDIPKLWNRFGPRIESIQGRAGGAYGVLPKLMRADAPIAYMAGVPMLASATIPPEYAVLQIPARRYAVFVHGGHVRTLRDTIGRAVIGWLPASGKQIDGEPEMLEFYGESYDPQTGLGQIEVWLPIKAPIRPPIRP